MICSTCRNDAGAGTAFCPHCGSPLSQAPPAAAPPSPPPAPAPTGPIAGPKRKPGGSKKLLAVVGCLLVLVVAAYFFLPGGLFEDFFAKDGSGDAPQKGVKLDPDTPPVRFTQPRANPLAGIPLGQSPFVFKVENVSPCDISAVKLAAVLFDENGKRLPGEPQEVGLTAGGRKIHPGDAYECRFTTSQKGAIQAVAVLQEVIYMYAPEGGKAMETVRVPMKWKNPRFEAEIEAAAAR